MTMPRPFLILALCFTIAGISAVACTGKSHKDADNSQSLDLSYHFNENDCDTGEHRFTSKESYCQALTDDELNHGCAIGSRMRLYSQNCENNTGGEPTDDNGSNTSQSYHGFSACLSAVAKDTSSGSTAYRVSFYCSDTATAANLSELSQKVAGSTGDHCPKTFHITANDGQNCTFTPSYLTGYSATDASQVEAQRQAICTSEKSVNELSIYGNVSCP